MHAFSIHSADDRHLGFLIIRPDDEHEQPPQSGQFAVKPLAGQAERDAAARLLAELAAAAPLFWVRAKDGVELFDGQHTPLGSIRQQYLTLCGQHFVLNDLAGTL